MIRAFLSVELSEPLRTNITNIHVELKQRLGRELSKDVRISWVQPASLHLTVKFLGDIDEQLVPPMQHAIQNVVSGHRALEIPLDRLGVFPRLQQPRILWVGPSEQWEKDQDAARLVSLHRAIEDCCTSLNLAPDPRPLSPHLTLARIKEGGRGFGQLLAKSGLLDKPLSAGSMEVKAIALMQSELKPTGSVYTKLWDVKVGSG
ncbi:MAG TPA: RNA 2',3'-cyclic phosphodiesterase [Nitrospira sp.]|nr:RNA 2',3'-cyclic phosphodiesterase [Nitrospira sp.]